MTNTTDARRRVRDDLRTGSAGAGGPSVFLERRSYRRRRLMDASKLLPVLGSVLFLIPLMWLISADAESSVPASTAYVYVFAVWAFLIVVNWVFGLAVGRWADDWGRSDASDRSAEDADTGAEAAKGTEPGP